MPIYLKLLVFLAASWRPSTLAYKPGRISCNFSHSLGRRGDGDPHFEAVIERASDEGAQLLEDAKANLESEYGGSTPSGGGSIAWLISGCFGKALFEPNVLCDDYWVDASVKPEDTNHYVLYPDISGSFAWLVDFDDACTGSSIAFYSDWDAVDETRMGTTTRATTV